MQSSFTHLWAIIRYAKQLQEVLNTKNNGGQGYTKDTAKDCLQSTHVHRLPANKHKRSRGLFNR